MILAGFETPVQRQRDDALRRTQAAATICRIAECHGVTYNAVMAPSRGSPAVANARHHVMAVVRWSTSWSLPQIARVFNRHDHTTVLSAIRKWEDILEREHATDGIVPPQAHDMTRLYEPEHRAAPSARLRANHGIVPPEVHDEQSPQHQGIVPPREHDNWEPSEPTVQEHRAAPSVRRVLVHSVHSEGIVPPRVHDIHLETV